MALFIVRVMVIYHDVIAVYFGRIFFMSHTAMKK